MKLFEEYALVGDKMSHSARSAWIETLVLSLVLLKGLVALRKEGVD